MYKLSWSSFSKACQLRTTFSKFLTPILHEIKTLVHTITKYISPSSSLWVSFSFSASPSQCLYLSVSLPLSLSFLLSVLFFSFIPSAFPSLSLYLLRCAFQSLLVTISACLLLAVKFSLSVLSLRFLFQNLTLSVSFSLTISPSLCLSFSISLSCFLSPPVSFNLLL